MHTLAGPLPLQLDLRAQRNADFLAGEFSVTALAEDGVTVEPIDLSDVTLSMQIRRIAGAPTLILNVPETGAPATTGIRKTDAGAGRFEITILRGVWAGPLPNAADVWLGAYDLIFTYPDTLREVFARGSFTLEPGVTA